MSATRTPEQLKARLEAAIQYDTNGGCWLWDGRYTTGYGKFRANQRQFKSAHRVAWELYIGPIPAGLFVLHKCDVRPCINPNHLFLGDHCANMADMVAKGRAGKSPNTTRRLSEAERAVLIDGIRRGLSIAAIARMVGVHKRAVDYWKNKIAKDHSHGQ